MSEIQGHWFFKCRKMAKYSLIILLLRHVESFAFDKP